jgi:endonuclease/exonuclease/phosphatase family metal-dependent hydrolase
MNQSFSLLTLNCFGLWMPGTKRRLFALAQELNQRPYQVVCLQEIQLHRYQQMLVKSCADYQHSHFERYIHCPKGGVLTLSRIPITSGSFAPYEERGLWHTPMLLDRLFYKGMLITKLTWSNVPIIIINTHILANYVGDWERGGMYSRVEQKQLQQLAKMVQAQATDTLILVVGDFNIPRGSKLYNNFLANSGLTDPLTGDTRATLRAPFGLQTRYALTIDYALYRMPVGSQFSVNCDLCFSSKHQIKPGYFDYVSDHVAIEIQITKS